MAEDHAEEMAEAMAGEMLEMMEVDDGAGGGEQLVVYRDPFEERKDFLVELESAGVEGVEDMAVEKCPACGQAWIEQLLKQSRCTEDDSILFYSFKECDTLLLIQDCHLPSHALQQRVVQVATLLIGRKSIKL